MSVVIDVDCVSKSYVLGAVQTSLREAIASAASKAFRSRGKKAERELFWALKDVSYQVQQGEVVGIIGHNGAGKSTMLKLLSRVTHPTKGSIRTRGRMASLIELGAGFHPDLSGRENIFLNGSILGLKQAEIQRQFDSIVSFAGLEQFIDTPVKRYSSGMYVRLAFAVASHVMADLLLVDEVLSVGDLSFQDRSLKKMQELRDNGATIVFISHNMNAVRSFCQRALLMDHGRLVGSGTPAQIIHQYEVLQYEAKMRKQREKMASQNADEPKDELVITASANAFKPSITNVEVLAEDAKPAEALHEAGGLCVRWETQVPDTVFKPSYCLRVCRASDESTCFVLWGANINVIQLHGIAKVEVSIPRHGLVAGKYYVEITLSDGGTRETLAFSTRTSFIISGVAPSEDEGFYHPLAEWQFAEPLPV